MDIKAIIDDDQSLTYIIEIQNKIIKYKEKKMKEMQEKIDKLEGKKSRINKIKVDSGRIDNSTVVRKIHDEQQGDKK